MEKNFCHSCGGETKPNQTLCVKCGVALGGGSSSGDKSKVAAGLLGIFLGCLGIHKFYLGYNKEAVIMLVISIASCGVAAPVMSVIGLVEGIIYLTKSDEDFVSIYVAGKKVWF